MALFKMGAFADTIRGKSGNTVFKKTKSGIVVTDLVIPTNPDTLKQRTIRNDFTRSTQTFATLTTSQLNAWKVYASKFTMRTKGGKLRKKTAVNVFAGLATKYLQVNPGGTIPTNPPATAFTGDAITVSASSGSAGTLTFTASGANSLGVKTELLLQPLADENRTPQTGAYRTQQFVAFASGSLTANISVPAGYYAAAYRFVKTSTGQATQLVPIPVVTVALSLAGSDEESAPIAKKKAA